MLWPMTSMPKRNHEITVVDSTVPGTESMMPTSARGSMSVNMETTRELCRE